jgi:hypothetical protein
MAKDIVKPIDPNFTTKHQKLLIDRFVPHFNNCIGAIDDTHIPVVVPASKLVQHVGRHGYSTQNVLAICDFDIRFTFIVAGWSGSVHDMRVFNDALRKYDTISPHPPPGTIILAQLNFFLLFAIKNRVSHNYLEICRKVLPCGFRVSKPKELSCSIQRSEVPFAGVQSRTTRNWEK